MAIDEVIAKIEAQIQGKEDTTVYMCGRQLEDIVRRDPQSAELVRQDLDIPEMSVAKCEAKIRAYAGEIHKKTKGDVGISPERAEKIICEFYGLASGADAPAPAVKPMADIIDLDSFF